MTGFTKETYMFIKENNDLSVIVNIANASLFSLRSQCEIYSCYLSDVTNVSSEQVYVSPRYNRDKSDLECEIVLLDAFMKSLL